MFRRVLTVGVAAALLATLLPASSGLAASVGDPVPLVAQSLLPALPDPAMLAAVQRDLGLTADEAIQRLGREEAAHGVEEQVRALAGSRYAGAWLEQNATMLRVGVKGAGLIQAIRQAGGTPVLMRYGLSELQAAVDRLRKMPFPSQSLSGWHIDIPTNRVVIKHLPGGRAAAEAFAAAGRVDADMLGYEVVSHHAAGSSEVLAGRAYENEGVGRCTLGFAVRDRFSPFPDRADGFLTAGHCGPRLTLTNVPGVVEASTFSDSFTGPDRGWIRITPSITTSLPLVFTGRSQLVPVVGSTRAAPGSMVCRSGASVESGLADKSYRCGTLGSPVGDIFLEFDSAPDRMVSGLVQLFVCSSKGDSGGPVITPGGQAQGITIGNIGASLGTKGCKDNPNNQTLFQPVQEVLDAYFLELILQPLAPNPLRVGQIGCEPAPLGNTYVKCWASWAGGVDWATGRWHNPQALRQPAVSSDPFARITSAIFDCSDPGGTGLTFYTVVQVTDAIGTKASSNTIIPCEAIW